MLGRGLNWRISGDESGDFQVLPHIGEIAVCSGNGGRIGISLAVSAVQPMTKRTLVPDAGEVFCMN